MKERLQKILANAGIASRRAAETMIQEGRVEVDGRVVRELGTSADPEVQEIRVDGTRVRPGKPRRTVALNKPKGYVTTRSDPGHRPTVMELLPHALQSLYPVGRLDMGSTGLLILTDDGELAQRLTHPRFGVEKSYVVTVAGRPDGKILDRAIRGIVVEGERLALEDIEVLGGRSDRRPSETDSRGDRTRLRATLRRGKYREIRRLFETLGHPVIDLHRERIGGLSVQGIPPGGFRPLSRAEVELLEKRPPKPRDRRRKGEGGRGARERSHQPERRASEASPEARSAGGGAPAHSTKSLARTKK